jgi:hypothetical protein
MDAPDTATDKTDPATDAPDPATDTTDPATESTFCGRRRSNETQRATRSESLDWSYVPDLPLPMFGGWGLDGAKAVAGPLDVSPILENLMRGCLVWRPSCGT